MTTTTIAYPSTLPQQQPPAAPAPVVPAPPAPGTDLPDRLVHELIRLVNEDVMTLDAGNTLLRALRLPTVPGGRTFTFRVPVAIPALGKRPTAIFRDAQSTIRPDTNAWRHTRVNGCPDGYAIEDLHEQLDGEPLFSVHTDLQVTVTVAAHPRGAAHTTARALLAADLATVETFTVRARNIELWDTDDEDGAEDYLDEEEDDLDEDVLGSGRTIPLTCLLVGEADDELDGTDLADAVHAYPAREFDARW